MRVLAMSSQKGGSGKTTLSGHLAVQAQLSGAGPVCLIDIDPQGSLADWWNEREADMPAFAQTTVARLASDLEAEAGEGRADQAGRAKACTNGCRPQVRADCRDKRRLAHPTRRFFAARHGRGAVSARIRQSRAGRP